jgi:hypothetical protein
MCNQDANLAEPIERVAYNPADVSGDRQVSWNGEDVLLRPNAGQLDLCAAEIGFCARADRHVGAFLCER